MEREGGGYCCSRQSRAIVVWGRVGIVLGYRYGGRSGDIVVLGGGRECLWGCEGAGNSDLIPSLPSPWTTRGGKWMGAAWGQLPPSARRSRTDTSLMEGGKEGVGIKKLPQGAGEGGILLRISEWDCCCLGREALLLCGSERGYRRDGWGMEWGCVEVGNSDLIPSQPSPWTTRGGGLVGAA